MTANDIQESKPVRNQERFKNRLEVGNTLILSIATLAITWCSYQSTLWNGIQTFKLAESAKYNRMAQEKNLATIQHQAMDENLVIGFVQLVLDNEKNKIDFSLSRVRPELAAVLRQWIALNPKTNMEAPAHPMAMKEYKNLFNKDAAEVLEDLNLADKKWAEAQSANTYSDRYSLFTVIFSMIMFLGAITTKLTQVKLSFLVILMSGVICIAILFLLFLYMPLAKK
jgi:hypothetical protein